MFPQHRLHGIVMLVCFALFSRGLAEEPSRPGFVNLDFEDGKTGWRDWQSTSPQAPASPIPHVDKATPRSGAASLKIIAKSPYINTMVSQETERFTRGVRYELSYWIKTNPPDMLDHCDIVVGIRKPKADGKGTDLIQTTPTMLSPGAEKGWWLRRGSFTVDKDATVLQLSLRVRNTSGAAWFDDIIVQEQRGPLRVDGLYAYTPEQVEIGPPMVDRFNKLVTVRSPYLDQAKVYNRLMVDVAFLTDEARRLERSASYLKDAGKTVDVTDELNRVQAIEGHLDELYRHYGKLFLAKLESPEKLDRDAAVLKVRLLNAREAVAKKLAALQKLARETGLQWTVPEEAKPKPIALGADGKPNQLIFGSVSLPSHFDLEEPLTVNRIHASSVFEMKGEPPAGYDFRGTMFNWNRVKALGATHSSIGTALAVHSNQMAPAWFLKKYENDPDIFMRGSDGLKAARPSWSMGAPLNTWRPEVREMTADFLTQLGKAFKDQSQFLFYVVAPENGGPYFPAERDLRSTGYNASALPDFHAWLKKRYETIDRLNLQWKTEYKAFSDIKPPNDLLIVNEWKRPHPVAYEFQSWRLDHHHGWLAFLYQTLKKADPNKPVMADHSALLAQVDGSRIFDTADILSFHHDRDGKTMLGLIYLNSMNRFANKQLGLYENMWGPQDVPLSSDERRNRATLTKYLYRLTTWKMHTQMWWYAYTSNDYMVQYNGNWFHPLYDLTTLRYSAAGVPVGKAKVKRLENVLMSAKSTPSRIAVIQPNTSMLFQNYWKESFVEMESLHDRLFGRGLPYELLPETYFTDGRVKLHDFDVVILPYSLYFPDNFSEMLSLWARKGGLLISLGPCGLYDKFGFDDGSLLRKALGDKLPVRNSQAFPLWDRHRLWRWELPRWKDVVLDDALGRGRVITSLRSLRDPESREQMAAKILTAIENRITPPARCTSHAFELSLQEGSDGSQYLVVINGNVDQAVRDTVTLTGEYKGAVDLDIPGGFPIRLRHGQGGTSFDLRLDAGDFTVIALK